MAGPETWQPWLDFGRNLLLGGLLVAAIGALVRLGRLMQQVDHHGARIDRGFSQNHADHEGMVETQTRQGQEMVETRARVESLDEKVDMLCRTED